MRVPIGDGWYLCDGTDRPEGDFFQFRGSKTLALQWARQFRGHLFAAEALRGLVRGTFSPRGDEETVEVVACRLASGAWLARRPVVKSAYQIRSREEQPAEAFPKETRRSPAPSGPSGPAPDPPLFPGDVDAGAIAAAQKEAAALGLPFCEECVREQLMAGR